MAEGASLERLEHEPTSFATFSTDSQKSSKRDDSDKDHV